MSDIRGCLTADLGDFSLRMDFTFPSRGITALFGRSGSGKSTLLRCFAGLEQSNGFLQVLGDIWQDDATGRHTATHKRPIGFVFQHANLFPHLSVKENLLYGWKRIQPQQRIIKYEDVVEWLGIAPLIDRSTAKLSGGERQRVAIGRALLTSPQLLLMDEPLAALDAISKEEILPYLEQLHRHLAIPVIYVSHSLKEVVRLADHVAWIDNGRIIAEGALPEMVSRFDFAQQNEEEAGAVLECRVVSHDERYHLTELESGFGPLFVRQLNHPPGETVRLHIRASDISLVRQRLDESGVLNVLPVQIAAVAEPLKGQVLVRLQSSDNSCNAPLLARITLRSCEKLQLIAGQQLYAHIKGVVLVR